MLKWAEVLIFVLFMGAALVISTPAQAGKFKLGDRAHINWYCTTAKTVEAVIMATNRKERNAAFDKGCFNTFVNVTVGKIISVVMDGHPTHQMFDIYVVKIDGGPSVFVPVPFVGKTT